MHTTRRDALRALKTGTAAVILLAAASGIAQAQPGDAAAVHQRALVLDAHVDVLLPSTNPRYRTPDGGDFADLAKLRAGGVDAVVYAVAVSTGPRTADGYTKAAAKADERCCQSNANKSPVRGRRAALSGSEHSCSRSRTSAIAFRPR